MNEDDLTALCDLTATAATVRPLLPWLDAADFARVTPCPGWTVRDLTHHLVTNALAFASFAAPGPAGQGAGALAGELADAASGDELARAYDAAIAEVARSYRAAMHRDAVLDTPFGALPAGPVLAVCVADQLTHAWDLATVTGTDIRPDPALVDRALATWRGFISDDMRGSGMFAPVAPAAAQASPLDQLAAFTGRTTA